MPTYVWNERDRYKPTNVGSLKAVVNATCIFSFSGHMEQLVRGFSADWKRGIESIDQEVMRSFSNFKNGTAILQV